MKKIQLVLIGHVRVSKIEKLKKSDKQTCVDRPYKKNEERSDQTCAVQKKNEFKTIERTNLF